MTTRCTPFKELEINGLYRSSQNVKYFNSFVKLCSCTMYWSINSFFNGFYFIMEYQKMKQAKYKIVRFFFKGAHRVIQTGLTRAEALEHCQNPETSSETCTTKPGTTRTENRGPWFEGFIEYWTRQKTKGRLKCRLFLYQAKTTPGIIPGINPKTHNPRQGPTH